MTLWNRTLQSRSLQFVTKSVTGAYPHEKSRKNPRTFVSAASSGSSLSPGAVGRGPCPSGQRTIAPPRRRERVESPALSAKEPLRLATWVSMSPVRGGVHWSCGPFCGPHDQYLCVMWFISRRGADGARLLRRVYEAKFYSLDGCLGAVGDLELGDDALEVALDRREAEVQLLGDPAVGRSSGEVLQYLRLPRR